MAFSPIVVLCIGQNFLREIAFRLKYLIWRIIHRSLRWINEVETDLNF